MNDPKTIKSNFSMVQNEFIDAKFDVYTSACYLRIVRRAQNNVRGFDEFQATTCEALQIGETKLRQCNDLLEYCNIIKIQRQRDPKNPNLLTRNKITLIDKSQWNLNHIYRDAGKLWTATKNTLSEEVKKRREEAKLKKQDQSPLVPRATVARHTREGWLATRGDNKNPDNNTTLNNMVVENFSFEDLKNTLKGNTTKESIVNDHSSLTLSLDVGHNIANSIILNNAYNLSANSYTQKSGHNLSLEQQSMISGMNRPKIISHAEQSQNNNPQPNSYNPVQTKQKSFEKELRACSIELSKTGCALLKGVSYIKNELCEKAILDAIKVTDKPIEDILDVIVDMRENRFFNSSTTTGMTNDLIKWISSKEEIISQRTSRLEAEKKESEAFLELQKKRDELYNENKEYLRQQEENSLKEKKQSNITSLPQEFQAFYQSLNPLQRKCMDKDIKSMSGNELNAYVNSLLQKRIKKNEAIFNSGFHHQMGVTMAI